MKKSVITQKSLETIETTIGDLIEAISEIALELGKSEQEGYELASLTIERILNTKNSRANSSLLPN